MIDPLTAEIDSNSHVTIITLFCWSVLHHNVWEQKYNETFCFSSLSTFLGHDASHIRTFEKKD